MPSPKRVSVKGKGADIFFGDYPELVLRPTAAKTAAPPPTASGPDVALGAGSATGLAGGPSQLNAHATPPPPDESLPASTLASQQESILAGEISTMAAPASTDTETHLPSAEPTPQPTRTSKKVRAQESENAREQARKQESKKASLLASESEALIAPDDPNASGSSPAEQARKQESKKASLLASKTEALIAPDDPNASGSSPAEQARKQESKKASLLASKNSDVNAEAAAGIQAADALAALIPFVSRAATITNAFRYTDEELSWLTDAAYVLSKRYHIKLAKQDIVRLGLNAILWDWQERGEASLLGTFANRRASREENRK